jgi:hypothetical protein
MDFEYSDEKGKRFTDVITKRAVYATMQTTTHLMRGDIHVRPDQRIKDELDVDEKFLAVTNVDVLAPDGHVLFHAPFLALNRAQIIWVLHEQNKKEGNS